MQKAFDSTKGFPGEGPQFGSYSWFLFASLPGIFLSRLHPLSIWISAFSPSSTLSGWIAAVLGGLLCLAARVPLLLWTSVCSLCFLDRALQPCRCFPRTPAERTKAALRQARPPVPPGRPVLPVTQQRRGKLLDQFIIWAVDGGLDMIGMLDNHHTSIDDINIILERYGRTMYSCGKTYGNFAETLNALTSWKPPCGGV